LGSSRFARRYSGNISTKVDFFSFPPLTEMFHFSGCRPHRFAVNSKYKI
jgi:hypothetical protein